MECNQRIFVVLIIFSAFINSSIQNESTTANIKLDVEEKLPTNWQDCSGLKVLSEKWQPKISTTSFIRKCCPLGESYEMVENGNEITKNCTADNVSFPHVSILNATFYENCIEDDEVEPTLDFSVVGACNFEGNKLDSSIRMFVYAKPYGDFIYVLQNGSLLVVDENSEAYDVYKDYCLDVDREGRFLYAIVCDSKSNLQARVLHAEAYLYATCLWLSVPCLLLTAFLYLKIGELRILHGKSLACHCVCLAIAYLLLGVIQFQQSVVHVLTYAVQYFLLACTCWMTALCCDICIKIMYIYLKKCSCSINTEDKYFTAYAIVSFGMPIIPVLLASWHHLYGIPIYYIKGQHIIDNITSDFYVFPMAILLILCLCCLCITFYAFGVKQPKLPSGDAQAICEFEEFYKMKQTSRNVAFLYGIMSMCILIEIIMSHFTAVVADATVMSPFAFFDILIALQGVFIFMIFICSPQPLKIIKRWWVATGTLDTTVGFTELEEFKTNLLVSNDNRLSKD